MWLLKGYSFPTQFKCIIAIPFDIHWFYGFIHLWHFKIASNYMNLWFVLAINESVFLGNVNTSLFLCRIYFALKHSYVQNNSGVYIFNLFL